LFSFLGSVVSCCFEVESDGANESVEVVGDPLVEAIELGAPVVLETSIGCEWIEETSGQRGVDSLEELEEDQGDGVALRGKLIAARVREPGKETFGAKF
jgi:hypothetical protein